MHVRIEYSGQLLQKLHMWPSVSKIMYQYLSTCFSNNFLSEARVAKNLVGMMPQRAVDIIRGGHFAGGDLVVLKSEVHRPSFREGCQMSLTFFVEKVHKTCSVYFQVRFC